MSVRETALSEMPPATAPSLAALVALAAILLSWLADYAGQAAYFGPGGSLSPGGLQSAVAQAAVVVAGLVLGLALVGRMELLARAVTALFLLIALIDISMWTAVRELPQILASGRGLGLLQGLSQTAQLALVVWLLRGPRAEWRRAGLVMAAVFLATQQLAQGWFRADLLYVREDPAAQVAPVDIEALYAAQEQLFGAQVAALGPGQAGEPEVFALTLGGTAGQSVFLSEVEGVAAILDAAYDAGGRTLRLANSRTAPLRYPMANRANLARALVEIGRRQGPEDLAFLFLTSHGQKDRFALDFPEAGTTDLTAADFARMLREAGIGPAVIVLSACFSGSFLDELAAPDRLVITAARGDRTSFGCRDGAEWTEFGRSLFDRALRVEADPRKAFRAAAEDVARKEVANGLPPSLPQMREGAAIGAVLDRVLTR